jgi:histone acetyltransferase (RNA polymerase elongator complex component)
MIIPIFIMNRGCPHRCLFCNERLTAGERPARVTDEAFAETIRAYLGSAGRKRGLIQIAFYGGTFTGMAPEEQRRLLELAAPHLRAGTVAGIRISTRPDEIDAEKLALLKAFGVSTVEVGAQSLDDEVLRQSKRGHTAGDTTRAVTLLKEAGFETGVHLMTGLPGESAESFLQTVEKAIAIRPGMVRIHPTIVLKDTPLADAFGEGRYVPLTMEEAIERCKQALKMLAHAGIPVIRLGLQTTRELEAPGAVVAGPFHPAFRSLVESKIFQEMAASLLNAAAPGAQTAAFFLAPADISLFPGAHRKTVTALKDHYRLNDIRVAAAPGLLRRTMILVVGDKSFATDWSGSIRDVPAEGLHAAIRHGIVRSNCEDT